MSKEQTPKLIIHENLKLLEYECGCSYIFINKYGAKILCVMGYNLCYEHKGSLRVIATVPKKEI